MFKSEREHVRHFLQKNVQLRSFWKFHVVVVRNNGKEMYKKSVLHVQSWFFANWTYCCFFTVLVAFAA